MTRPLRIDVEDGWYHVMSRGIERRTIFVDASYNQHFLDLLEAMSERFSVEVHAYALMGNHYHLILRTPHANCSQAMQWLNVSYSAWYNAKRQRVGPVFQGRFRSALIDGNGAWLLDASVYIHLNPVRTSALGLGKATNKAEAKGFVKPERNEVKDRLTMLREHVWSSYRAYGNYTKIPKWLCTEQILSRAGGKSEYRKYVQQHVTRGLDTLEFTTFRESIAIGSHAFLEAARSQIFTTTTEQPDRSFVRRDISFENIVSSE